MAKYKADQGTYARGTGMWLLGALWVFGCHSMYYWLLSFKGDDGEPGFLGRHLTSGNLPVISVPLTWSLLVATAIGLAGLFVIYRVLNAPKTADLLIESETEMRKCTWPAWSETVTSSIVIVIVMLFFTFLLAGMDFVLNTIMVDYVF